MLKMENAEEVMQILERFTRLKQKEIPKELDDYMHYVAKTGDTVFKWSSLKYLFREKLLNVIKNFHDTSPRVDDLPQYPNVDPFNYESMKSSLLERLDLFNAAPFTVQRLCELLTEPRKQYSRIDKFMRALEKNILVVSTIEPGRKRTESENGDSLDSVVNGDASLDVNVDIDMENVPKIFMTETPNATSSSTPLSQASSILNHKPDDEILPNPKKPKLDLETSDLETEAATKSIINNKTDLSEPSVEAFTVEKSFDFIDNKNEGGRVPGESIVCDEKIPEVAIAKDSECEKMEEESDVILTIENNITDNKIKETEQIVEIKKVGIAILETELGEVEKVTPTTSTRNNVSSVKAMENNEKLEKVIDVKQATEKLCAEVVLDKHEPSNETDAGKKIKESEDRKENQNGNIKETKEKTETAITTTNQIINNEKSEKIVSASSEEILNDSKTEVETSKTENISVASAGVIEESVVEVEAMTAVQVVPIEEIKNKSTAVTADHKTDTAVDSLAMESLQKGSTDTLSDVQLTELKETDTEKLSELPVTTTNESKDISVPAAVKQSVVVADQPMEENIESTVEAEPLVSSIVEDTAANVDEVIMGDSVEMATDAIHAIKDEQSGMEVDDTSQEAMDQ